MVDRDREKSVADRRKGKSQRYTLGRFDYQGLFGFDQLDGHSWDLLFWNKTKFQNTCLVVSRSLYFEKVFVIPDSNADTDRLREYFG